MNVKKNCWDHFGCGREVGGDRADELGVCQAAVIGSGSPGNGEDHDGRFCRVAGITRCAGALQRTFAGKITDCIMCEFYEIVQGEEDRSPRFF
jgi:hypothetical protein